MVKSFQDQLFHDHEVYYCSRNKYDFFNDNFSGECVDKGVLVSFILSVYFTINHKKHFTTIYLIWYWG